MAEETLWAEPYWVRLNHEDKKFVHEVLVPKFGTAANAFRSMVTSLRTKGYVISDVSEEVLESMKAEGINLLKKK